MDLQKRYSIYIYELFKNLTSYTNQNLCKIFEYYVCIKLKEKYNHDFYEYYDIPVEFKEENNLSKNDTGIDCCDLDKTIVQCKLRKKELGWNEISTFVATQNIFNTEKNEVIVRWPNLILARNDDSKLTNTLEFHAKRIHLIDNLYNKDEMIKFCKSLSHSIYSENNKIVLRDYQLECIDLIKKNSQNIIINLPTGTGKNIIIVNSFEANKKYLILVPKIILMDQIEKIIKENNSKLKIQKYGDNSKKQFDDNKDITICIYNSIELIKEHYHKFHKIFIDEGHHILQPIIYKDEEDETENTDTYITKIQELSKFNNNVLLSATIDKKDGYLYYSKDIRDMIELGYLSDYTISIPIFKEDPTNYNICKYLIQNYMYVIIYCNSKLEAKKIHNLMNQIQPNVSKYIDCDTPKKEREKIILDYKNGLIPFLVNIHVLIEGFDAPITRGVTFLHLPSKKQTIIQTIGRCLRPHALKNYASVILPFSTETDGKAIDKFLKILATNDSRIKKSYQSKNMCGYINPIKIIEDEEDYKELELKYEMIYSSTGKLLNEMDLFLTNLNKLKEYIDEHGIRPRRKDDNEDIKYLARWTESQVTNYNQNTKNMKKSEIFNLWEEFINDEKYKNLFNIIDTKKYENYKEWIINLQNYIDKYNKRPSDNDKNEDIQKLATWCNNQVYKYNKGMIKDETKKELWEKLINNPKYKTHFKEKIIIDYKDRLKFAMDYIDKYSIRPLHNDKDEIISSNGRWLTRQNLNYYKNEIKDKKNKELWEKFINNPKYGKYFKERVIITLKNGIDDIKKYIDDNNKLPNSGTSQRKWLKNQLYYYKSDKIKNEENKKIIEEFISNPKYSKYL
jgi:superfamily II DNA or RNA helicase